MGDTCHVDTQFLRSALGVFEDGERFEQAARSRDPATRAANVAALVDALDFCNLLILSDRIVFDSDVGGGRHERILEQISRVGRSLGDGAVERKFQRAFAGVAPLDDKVSWALQLRAARNAAAFFPQLARCAANVLDLFYLPHAGPSEPGPHLLRFLEARRPPSSVEIEQIEAKKTITGRRFYAAILSEETAFRALCDAHQRVQLTDDVLAALFMNFRLRLAEERSISREKVMLVEGDDAREHHEALTYLPSMGRRDFTREFSQFVRWGADPNTRHGHAFDLGLREYVLQEWEGIGCQVQLSERRTIPIVVAAIMGSARLTRSPNPQTLLSECLRWREECQGEIEAIREATREFESLADEERQRRAATFAAEILRAPSTEAARNRAIGERLAVRDKWLGLCIRAFLSPLGTLQNIVVDSTDKVRQHFATVSSNEYKAATHLSEAARPLLLGVGPQVRQCLIDIFGGTVIDARNPTYDPDRFVAKAD